MYNFRTINIELENLESLKTVAGVYQEIAAIYIQKNKEIILESRNFYDGLSEIFNEIVSAYQKSQKIWLRKKEGNLRKKAMVLMSANAGLYGEIVGMVFKKFENDAALEKTDRDLIIIGKTGKELMRGSVLHEDYQYFDFPDAKFNLATLKPIIELLASYEEVSVYYGSFKNLAVQRPAVKNIRAAEKETDPLPGQKILRKKGNYIFEPSLESLRGFFEEEFFSSIIEQLSYEFTLSKLSSRTLLLDKVIGNIEKKAKRFLLMKQKSAHDSKNKKQTDSLPGILQAAMI